MTETLEPGFYKHYDRKYKIVAEFVEGEQGRRDANKFMSDNPGVSLLAITNGRVILVDNEDKGIKVNAGRGGNA